MNKSIFFDNVFNTFYAKNPPVLICNNVLDLTLISKHQLVYKRKLKRIEHKLEYWRSFHGNLTFKMPINFDWFSSKLWQLLTFPAGSLTIIFWTYLIFRYIFSPHFQIKGLWNVCFVEDGSQFFNSSGSEAYALSKF